MKDARDLRVVEVARQLAYGLDDLLGCAVRTRLAVVWTQAHHFTIRHRAALPHDSDKVSPLLGLQLHFVDERS